MRLTPVIVATLFGAACSRFVWHEDPFTPDKAPTSETIVAGGDWATAGNWSNGVPNATSDVVINGNVTVVHSANADQVNTISIGTGATLQITSASEILTGHEEAILDPYRLQRFATASPAGNARPAHPDH